MALTNTDNRMLIDGKWVAAAGGQEIEVLAPHDGSLIASVPRGGEADIINAVGAASRAFPAWRSTPARQRGRALLAIADRLEEEAELIARVTARETGNAIRTQSRPESKAAADFFRYFGGLASEIKGESSLISPTLLNYSLREPHGVVGAIVAWNSPLMLAATKLGMALATGNTVVLKAPEDAPLGVLRIGAACEAFLPPGVVNVVTGYGEEAGRPLVRNPAVAKITFTGSTEVGREIATVAGSRLATAVLELGGKSPAIVCDDSDDDTTAAGVIAGMRFTRQGQGCTAGSRLFVHESVFDSFLERASAAVEALKVGDPLDEATDIGTVINRKQYDRICAYIRDGISQGGRVLTGGLPDADSTSPGPLYLRPTIFADVDPSWRIVREEIFGPVMVAIPWSGESEVIAMANDTHYGLSAYVWCRDIARALRFAHAIDAGSVQVNRGSGPVPGMSSGGIKMSGSGREHSIEGALDDFTYRKNITIAVDH